MSYCETREGCFTYLPERKSASRRTADLETWVMPAGDYIICSFEAENFYLLTTNALNKARDYMFGVWLKNNGLAVEPFMAELYFDTSPDGTVMELWFRISPQPVQSGA